MGEGTVERIGGYRIVRRLATGGTSEVLLAKAEGPYGFERTVVLKLLLTKYRDDEAFARMFAREATAYARLSHPSIVRLYDFFSHGGALVMALEHVDGPPLHKLRTMLKNAGTDLDDEASIHIGARLFAALAAAHSARDPATGALAPVMHRDVNPSNVLIPWEGYVKLADFGIAKVAGLPSDTQVGLIKGTYGYMAPEQVRGDNVSIRADVYAGAIVLWELFARRKAIYGGALPEVEILKAMADPRIVPLDVLRPDVDATVREAIARALEPNPDKRLITAEEMVSVLKDACDPEEGREHLVDALERARPHPATERLLKEPTRANRGPVSTLKGMPQVPTPVPPPLASGRTESDLPPALKPALARELPRPAPAPASGLPASLHPENVLAELVAGAAAERISGALGDMFPPSTRSPPTTQRTDPPANVLRELQEDEETQQRIAPTTAEVEAALAQSDRAPPVGLPPPRPPPGRPPSAAPATPRVSEDNAMSAALVSAVARELPRMGTLMSNGSPPRPPMAPKPQAAKPAAPAAAAPVAPAPALDPPNDKRTLPLGQIAPRIAPAPVTPRLDVPSPLVPHDPFAPTAPAHFAVPDAPALAPPIDSPSPPPVLAPEPLPAPSAAPRKKGSAALPVALAVMLVLAGASAGAAVYVKLRGWPAPIASRLVRPPVTAPTTTAPTTTVLATSARATTAATVVPVAVSTVPEIASSKPAASSSVAPSASVAPLASASAAASATAGPSSSVAPLASASAAASATAASSGDVPADKTELSTAGAVPGRRVFVDDKVVGQTPGTFVIPCGAHVVKIGSSGYPQSLTLPCGGRLSAK